VYLVAGAAFYRFTDAEGFSTLGQAVYFTTVTCTTVGYGDMVPSTAAGRLFRVCYAMAGMYLMSLGSTMCPYLHRRVYMLPLFGESTALMMLCVYTGCQYQFEMVLLPP
jgi:hypothetical protein